MVRQRIIEVVPGSGIALWCDLCHRETLIETPVVGLDDDGVLDFGAFRECAYCGPKVTDAAP